MLTLIHLLPTIFSFIAAIVAAFAGKKASDVYKLHKLSMPQYPEPPKHPKRRRFGRLFGISPNDNAGPADIANKLDGIDGATGAALSYRLAAMFYQARMFGRAKDYAFPEGPNVTASMGDHATSLAKLHTRTMLHSDKNEYDLWDATMSNLKANLLANPHLNDDEVNSVNYKAPSKLAAEKAGQPLPGEQA